MADKPLPHTPENRKLCYARGHWSTLAGVALAVVAFCIGAHVGIEMVSATLGPHGPEPTWPVTVAAALIGGCVFSSPLLICLLIDLVRHVLRRSAGTRDGALEHSPSADDRVCPGCKASVPGRKRYCESCGRFVPGGPSSATGFASTTTLVLAPGLLALMILGYIWIPIVGFMAEAALWFYAWIDHRSRTRGSTDGIV